MVQIDGIGTLEPHEAVNDWVQSKPLPIAFLSGKLMRIVFDADGLRPDAYSQAIRNLLSAQLALLAKCEEHVVQYCRDTEDAWGLEDEERIVLSHKSDVWRHVRFGEDIHAKLRQRGDDEDDVYFSLECGCDWEEEHGLQLVIRNGSTVSKVGPYDGHLTNTDSYADRSLKGVVYKPLAS